MRRFLLAAAAAIATSLAAAGGASAQSSYVETYDYGYAPYGYYYTAPAAPAPVYREYGYRPAESFAVRPDFPPGGCGTYRFWRNGRCVDARYLVPGE